MVCGGVGVVHRSGSKYVFEDYSVSHYNPDDILAGRFRKVGPDI
jgi:hypothetical protein